MSFSECTTRPALRVIRKIWEIADGEEKEVEEEKEEEVGEVEVSVKEIIDEEVDADEK